MQAHTHAHTCYPRECKESNQNSWQWLKYISVVDAKPNSAQHTRTQMPCQAYTKNKGNMFGFVLFCFVCEKMFIDPKAMKPQNFTCICVKDAPDRARCMHWYRYVTFVLTALFIGDALLQPLAKSVIKVMRVKQCNWIINTKADKEKERETKNHWPRNRVFVLQTIAFLGGNVQLQSPVWPHLFGSFHCFLRHLLSPADKWI